MTDPIRVNEYVWTDGTPLTGFTYWNPNEPNHLSGTQCIWYWNDKWDDAGCGSRLPALCEKTGKLSR